MRTPQRTSVKITPKSKYMLLDSNNQAVAEVYCRIHPSDEVVQIELQEVDSRQMEGERVTLLGVAQDSVSVSGRVIKQKGNIMTVEVSQMDKEKNEKIRKNLRIKVQFESFLYPVSGKWHGRETVTSCDISCGGVAFYCSRKLAVGEVAQMVIPITSQPLILTLRVLRLLSKPTEEPLYAAEFLRLIPDEEAMVREAVFGLQFQG